MPQKTKLQILGEIVVNYDRRKHEAQLLPDNHSRYTWYTNFRRLNPAAWTNPESIPYVAATGLIDAYSQLPKRPDLAFNSLWSATNSSYNDFYLSNHLGQGAKLSDSKSIEFSLDRIAQQLHQQIPLLSVSEAGNSISISDLIKEYIKIAPDKNFNFVAQFVLRGIAVDNHNNPPLPAIQDKKIRDVLIPSSYTTFKKKFPAIHERIKNSTGTVYSSLCTISESTCRTDINFGIQQQSKERIRKLVHATGLILREEALGYPLSSSPQLVGFVSSEDWLAFLIFPLLYATRNTAAHGNAASRLNSIFANGDSVTSASWTFLFCYLYFSLILMCQSKITLSDLEPLYYNSRLSL